MEEKSSENKLGKLSKEEKLDYKLIIELRDIVEEFSEDLQRMNVAEYIELFNSPKRMIYINFIAGLARGLGVAIGMTILGGIFLSILYKMAELNLPLIGKYIADLVIIVRQYL